MSCSERRRRNRAFARVLWSNRHADSLATAARRSARMSAARRVIAILMAALLGIGGYHVLAADPTPASIRAAAQKAQRDGNWKDAFEAYERLLADPRNDPAATSPDMVNAVQCLNQLGRTDETDALIEKTVKTHADNWRLLETAAQQYHELPHYGTIVAGTFYRGDRRGEDGKQVSSFERDRVRSLQLMQQAMAKVAGDANKAEASRFYLRFADQLLGRRYGMNAWQLQYLTDLARLPDYEENGGRYFFAGHGNGRGAPVDADGKPVFHTLPKSWEAAQSDGQRWRWCLMQAAEADPRVADEARLVFAGFLREQFDVQTMLASGRFPRRPAPIQPAAPGVPGPNNDDDTRNDESGPYAVHTLGEDETIARLANGIKRFKLPDEFNFIRILQDIGEKADATQGTQALTLLANVFEDRQQLPRAAEFWKRAITKAGIRALRETWMKERLDQIVGNWGEFDAENTNPAGVEPTVGFLFRNGKSVSFTAQKLDVDKVLTDVKAYIKSKPRHLDWQRTQVEQIGFRVVEQNQNQYLLGEPTKWQMDLQPRAEHRDRRVYVKPPVKDAGAYLVTAKMADGNTTRMVLWIADTALVKKPINGGTYLYVGDALSGAPLPKANVSFFGYQQRWEDNAKGPTITTHEFAQNTDAEGQLVLKPDAAPDGYNWLIQVQAGERRAFLGFSHVWTARHGGFPNFYDAEYHANKAFTVTDRPVYRPGQTMQFKTWIGQAKYDMEGPSPYADKTFSVAIMDPRGQKVLERAYTADRFGGIAGELPLSKDMTLGTYTILVQNFPDVHEYGGNSFRLEEYKKPEFEVLVDAPTEPVKLGDKIVATVKANYYFGAPVTNAKVKYKVLRSSYRAQWYPPGRWDWFYEPGYWWFAENYLWYPGFREWGCFAPVPPWFGRGYEQPELVAENEVAIAADGTVKVDIDTAPALALHGYTDHKYEITAEVTDESRRTIVGNGTVSVARKPFKVYAWVDRGYYAENDIIKADFAALTIDNKPVKGKGELKLLKVSYDPARKPVEKAIQTWALDPNAEGRANQQIKAAEPGQYRLSYTVTDPQGRSIEGGYVFVIRGPGFDGADFRFNDIELTADKAEYANGDTVQLMINTNQAGSTVLLFERAANGVGLQPKVLKLNGKSQLHSLPVTKRDMPNFFVEAVTISNGQVFSQTRELVVPPESRVTNIEVKPSRDRYKPGEKATFTFRLTDAAGKPVVGTALVSLYDKSVEYVSGGSNTPDIRKFFWQWRRHHHPQIESSLARRSGPVHKSREATLRFIGQFGFMSSELGPDDALAEADRGAEMEAAGLGNELALQSRTRGGFGGGGGGGMPMPAAAPMAATAARRFAADAAVATGAIEGQGQSGPSAGEAPVARTKFADTALWATAISTNANGEATVSLDMPENLTTWKARVHSMSDGTRVGQGETSVTTFKDLIVRLQAPRFFVEKDEVVLSANVHNYTAATQQVRVELALPGGVLSLLPAAANAEGLARLITLAPNGEQRVDWRVKVAKPGTAVVRMSAVAGTESDATEMSFPAYIHGMLKTESFSGALRPADRSGTIQFNIPAERLPEHSRVEIRYSPSVATAMVDALPYLVDYPYGCTEQTLNRFLPTVITQRVLLNMGLDLKAIRDKRTNLNAQEIGDDAKRAADWKRNNPPKPGTERNPVFDADTVAAMSRDGVTRLTNMQNGDGGWGWFSGTGESSFPHTTAVVVHGLQIARETDVAIVPGVLENGVEWLARYQAQQINLLNRALAKVHPYKEHADDTDALVYMVLVDAGRQNDEMREFLYRDRNFLAVYTKAMFGLALHKQLPVQKDKLDMILQNISQFLVKDAENQTAYLKMPEGNRWWCWHGSDVEANAYYLKLLAKTDPKGETPALLARYLINNRKHATYWNSTRDTAVAIEALADFVRASGEDKPDLTVRVLVDGKQAKQVKITPADLFSFDNKLVIDGAAVTPGKHTVEVQKEGNGPLYFNAYVTNFTLEDPIAKTGLEVRVDRKFYKLVRVDKSVKVEGGRGQALDQKVEAYKREELKDLGSLASGDLVEVELEIDSKNDYEYLIFEDFKPAGFEPVEVRSGYNGNDLNAYVEFRDERVAFFARTLARGKHSVSYRLRAEIPGKFSALPTKASAMYAPEIKANSDEFKVLIGGE